MTSSARQVLGVVVLGGFLMGVSGCDWWPPALQERIGQQDAQIKVLQAEKTRLQGKVTELSQSLQDASTRAAQMEQASQDLRAQMELLKASLAEAQAKSAKTSPAAKRRR
jgi:uncharacterized protein YlxW (UPF0749 family)